MEPSSIFRDILQAAVRIPEPFSSLSEDDKKSARQLLSLFEQAESQYGGGPDGDVMKALLLGKNGRFAEALALAEQRYRQAPNWNTVVAAANAARRGGDFDRAAAMFAKGAEHDPQDVTCFLEIGDIRLHQSRLADSLAAYEEALAKEPSHQWALPSAFYCRHQLGIPGNWLASLREVANQETCTCGLEGCLTVIFGGNGSRQGIKRAKHLLDKVVIET